MQRISEIQIVPVKPNEGLIAFCSFVLYEEIYCGSIAIFTRQDGSYRLVYPTKKVANKNIDLFHPINKKLGEEIETAVLSKFNEVMSNDRHGSTHNS